MSFTHSGQLSFTSKAGSMRIEDNTSRFVLPPTSSFKLSEMVGPSKTSQYILAILMVVFGILLLAFQIARRSKTKGPISREDNALWVCEVLAAIALVAVVIANIAFYWGYIPSDSPGCLPFVSQYGVVASAVDPHTHAVTPKTSYPALTYADAIIAYKGSPNGLATGYFSWDGISVTILDSSAHVLSSGAPAGTSWVFQDLNTATARTV